MNHRTTRWSKLSLALAATFTLASLVTGSARAETWTLDSSHSKASFKVRHLMISNVEGLFQKVEGTVEGDPAKPESATVTATIDASSITTGNEKRDEHLRSPDFFEVAKYPTITFKSKQIRKWTGTSFELVGDLTIRGVTKEAVLVVSELTPEIKDPWGNTKRGASATTTIDRKDFGIVWNKALDAGGVTVGDEVKITIEVELQKKG